MIKYGVAGLSLLALICSTLFGDSTKVTGISYQRLGIQAAAIKPMVESQNQPSTQESAPPATGKAGNNNAKGTAPEPAHDITNQKTRLLKIAVTQITSSADQSLSVEGMQQELANDINFLGGKAIIIGADPNDREAANEQSKQQGCDYIVFTDITNFKTVSVGQKLGNVLNKQGGLGGVGGSGHGRVEISANVRIFQPDVFTPTLDGSSDFRGNDIDNTVKGLMRTEARTIMLELKKLESKGEK